MSSAYLQLQSTAQGTTLGEYEPIRFDYIVSQLQSAEIIYDNTTGIIQFNKEGVYYLDWFVVTDTSGGPVSILLQTTDLKIINSDTSLIKDEVTGSAIITVGTEPRYLVLTNGMEAITLGNVPVVANLVIHSTDMDEITGGNNQTKICGSTINFQNGVIDCPVCNPFSWPVLLDFLDISWRSEQVAQLLEQSSNSGMEALLDLNSGVLGAFAITNRIAPVISALQMAVSDLDASYHTLSGIIADAGLLSTDVYLNHASAEVVPSVSGFDVPIFGLDGPIMPQILAEGGVITAFAAEYDSVVSFDFSCLNLMPGSGDVLNTQINDVNNALELFSSTLGDLASVFDNLLSPLPEDYADRLRELVLSPLSLGLTETNHHVHAILWHRADEAGNNVQWHKVTELDLGAVDWLGLAPVETFASTIGDIFAAASSLLGWIFALLTGRGARHLSPTNIPLRAGSIKGLNYPVSAGDYLLVQFKLVGENSITLAAGVIATNVMASVAIDCPAVSGGTDAVARAANTNVRRMNP